MTSASASTSAHRTSRIRPTPTRCRRTAGIAIAAVAAVCTAACAHDTTKLTDSAATVPAVATRDPITTPPPSDTPAMSPTPTIITADEPGVESNPTATPTTVAVGDVPAQLRSLLEDTVAASASIPGLALRVDAPERHLDVNVAAGVADRATARPLTPDAGLRIASNTKTFTAAAVLRLVEQGRLALDTPLDQLLAPDTVEALDAGGYRPDIITVRQLLLHTSGIYDYGKDPAYQAAVAAEPGKRWTRLEQVRFAMDHGAPVAEPGTTYAYTDTGYILLGEIIERTAGTPLADAYRTLLDFHALHLDATYLETLEPTPPGAARRAHQYVGDLDGYDLDPSFDLYGAAGLVSTVGELATFYRALLHGDVFANPATLDTMLEIPASNAEAGAAMGIFRVDLAGNTCWSHSGFWGTFVVTCPQIDVTMAVAWNQATPSADFDAEHTLRQLVWLATAP